MTEADLFSRESDSGMRPLADRIRPRTMDEFVGQSHIVGPGKPLRRAIEEDRLHSMIFWGPPGTGKTTLASLIARHSGANFLSLSAVLSGVKDIRAAVEQARLSRQQENRATVLFIDEVHRFNKSQQDAFLPHVEDGTVVFIGATTENPSFELNNALLSRARTYVLKSLTEEDIKRIIQQALSEKERGLGERELHMDDEVCGMLAEAADGDARRALNLLEIASDLSEDSVIGKQVIEEVATGTLRRFDKGGEAFYDQISALHKSVRGSAPQAALYWLARMIDGGCDPLYIARRVVRMASEDIGNADPRALEITLNAWDTQERLGSPEGELAIAQAVTYLACAPKSNAVYSAWKSALAEAKQSGSLDVPLHLRNAPTKLMKELDYGKAYRYAHDEPQGYAAGENYLPEQLTGREFYFPVDRGLEIKIAEKLAYLKKLNAESL
ncbi:MAG: recombination factor protein RarA [endosymbiont of Seepiophila jonesi]|uniref:Replication-associated recombination protein A n=1 Tax=endosymbiont of Lamellibrachia luymesi TaxID=2200907 RepID=A0A370DZQ1_9GAMM|nr:MAG: recombination factor protein RarA [endosymbiont of Lamellibrachia luymesi]RDH93301.1 MAG: recombination factor protein RarA [endosymbiont of Seepiophila jonesi]